jgi:hypothetical protein
MAPNVDNYANDHIPKGLWVANSVPDDDHGRFAVYEDEICLRCPRPRVLVFPSLCKSNTWLSDSEGHESLNLLFHSSLSLDNLPAEMIPRILPE